MIVTHQEQTLRRICVYCGSSPGRDPQYSQGARQLGHILAGDGITLVYGGGDMGLMGDLARAAIDGEARSSVSSLERWWRTWTWS